MKLIAKFLNLIMWVVSFCLATLAQMGIWDLVALPSGTDGLIGFDANSTTSVSYFDTFKFWGEDIKASVERQPRYAIRGWFGAHWWENGMEWADKAVECVVGAVVPIATPTYEANQMKKYYDTPDNIDGFIMDSGLEGAAIIKFSGKDVSSPSSSDYKYIYTFISGITNKIITEIPAEQKEISYDLKTSSGVTLINRAIHFQIDQLSSPVSGLNMKESANRQFFNTLCKISKYNSDTYTNWMAKMYRYDDTSKSYIMKSSVVGLYFQFYMAIIFATFFLVENPIVVERQGDGSNSVSGGLHMHWSHKHKKKEKDDKK